jgi:hypothetical protein
MMNVSRDVVNSYTRLFEVIRETSGCNNLASPNINSTWWIA